MTLKFIGMVCRLGLMGVGSFYRLQVEINRATRAAISCYQGLPSNTSFVPSQVRLAFDVV